MALNRLAERLTELGLVETSPEARVREGGLWRAIVHAIVVVVLVAVIAVFVDVVVVMWHAEND